jgi:CheY-like chemotaxis protein
MIYGFARQSGGQVRIESRLGHGTSMHLYLPRHRGEAGSRSTGPPPDATQGARARRDGAAGRGRADGARTDDARCWSNLGYNACWKRRWAVAGLECCSPNRRIDLLVTDVGLPGGMNGRQVADAARSLKRPT